jgi:hypothetical protein
MNSAASIVLPQPGPPVTSDGRPRGRPPPVISSSPSIPLGAFATGVPAAPAARDLRAAAGARTTEPASAADLFALLCFIRAAGVVAASHRGEFRADYVGTPRTRPAPRTRDDAAGDVRG